MLLGKQLVEFGLVETHYHFVVNEDNRHSHLSGLLYKLFGLFSVLPYVVFRE